MSIRSPTAKPKAELALQRRIESAFGFAGSTREHCNFEDGIAGAAARRGDEAPRWIFEDTDIAIVFGNPDTLYQGTLDCRGHFGMAVADPSGGSFKAGRWHL